MLKIPGILLPPPPGFSACEALGSMPLNKGQLLAMPSAFLLTLSPTFACLSYGITTQMGCRDTPWCTALSCPFGWSAPGEASGSKACSLQRPGNTKGQGPQGACIPSSTGVLGQSYSSSPSH